MTNSQTQTHPTQQQQQKHLNEPDAKRARATRAPHPQTNQERLHTSCESTRTHNRNTFTHVHTNNPIHTNPARTKTLMNSSAQYSAHIISRKTNINSQAGSTPDAQVLSALCFAACAHAHDAGRDQYRSPTPNNAQTGMGHGRATIDSSTTYMISMTRFSRVRTLPHACERMRACAFAHGTREGASMSGQANDLRGCIYVCLTTPDTQTHTHTHKVHSTTGSTVHNAPKSCPRNCNIVCCGCMRTIQQQQQLCSLIRIREALGIPERRVTQRLVLFFPWK